MTKVMSHRPEINVGYAFVNLTDENHEQTFFQAFNDTTTTTTTTTKQTIMMIIMVMLIILTITGTIRDCSA